MASSTSNSNSTPTERSPLLFFNSGTQPPPDTQCHCPGTLPIDTKPVDDPAENPPSKNITTPITIQPAPPFPEVPPRLPDHVTHQDPRLQRLIPDEEWTKIAYSLGAIRSLEDTKLVHPSTGPWAPRGMPPGLYRDIVFYRTKYFYLFQFICTVRWIGMVAQILLGASLTAIGSLNVSDHGVLVTGLAGLNTIIAGILALIHNSGLPNRYRSDRAEFIHVEDYVRQILEGAVVDDGMTTEDIITECFERFKEARESVFTSDPEAASSTMIATLRANGVRQGTVTFAYPSARPGRVLPMGPLDWRPSLQLSSSHVYAAIPPPTSISTANPDSGSFMVESHLVNIDHSRETSQV